MSQQVMETHDVRRVPVRQDALVTVVAAAAAVIAWAEWTQGAGIDLVVRRGSGTTTVDAAATVVTVLVVGAVGAGLLRLLESRTPNGLRTWTILAVVVAVLSLGGPLGATTVAAGLALTSLHAVVAVTVIVGERRLHRSRVGVA
jgi:hypothetical protein